MFLVSLVEIKWYFREIYGCLNLGLMAVSLLKNMRKKLWLIMELFFRLFVNNFKIIDVT